MIACEACGVWYHGRCVHVAEDDATSLGDDWYCPRCLVDSGGESEDDAELYCLCKKPYQDDDLMIECDHCHDWFHTTCLGLGTSPPTDKISRFSCKACRPLHPAVLIGRLQSLQNGKIEWQHDPRVVTPASPIALTSLPDDVLAVTTFLPFHSDDSGRTRC
eukprot:TRINITY_DN27520_c0_g1_i2.p1 TRINITY_DN27520_c0_g1~~TRINITY_DN27520_c0_g1_i2.p1  ORF type:complete len:161 (+),score=20.42 TRINITY_DN27520_c0_g1_i2:220-702(+)